VSALARPAVARLKGRAERLYQAVDDEYRRRILELLPRGAACGCSTWAATTGSGRRRCAGAWAPRPARPRDRDRPGAAAPARARGFEVRGGDLEERWPFEDASADVVHANQVIEHVKRLDHFVGEVRRVLAAGGVAVVCTENLASWHNVAALVLGLMPFSLTDISATGPVGNPFALHAGEPVGRGESWQHIHVLTTVALRDLFAAHGFAVERTFAAGYYPAVGRLATALAARDPRHAHFIGIVARRRR